MKSNERFTVSKVRGIKGFFMWLFGINRVIQEVIVPTTTAEPIPNKFDLIDAVEHLHKKLKEEVGCETKNNLTIVKPKPKQNLSTKYNPNVRRASNGRYESLK